MALRLDISRTTHAAANHLTSASTFLADIVTNLSSLTVDNEGFEAPDR